MTYLMANGLFILPANMIYISEIIADFLFSFYFVRAVTFVCGFYYMLGLAFVHIMLNAGFAIYSVVKFVYVRDWLMFVLSLAAVAFSVWANVFLLQH